MIITCEECTTRFKLDDARVPEKGAKVRCSKCKHAFFVKPQASAGDPVENAVSQALTGDDSATKELSGSGASGSRRGSGEPSAEEGMDGLDDAGDTSSSFRAPDDQSAQEAIDEYDSAGDTGTSLRAPDEQSAQDAMDEFEESDWEFNTDASGAAGEEPGGFQEPPGLALDDGGDSSELREEIGTAPELGDELGASSELTDSSGIDLGGDADTHSQLDLDGGAETPSRSAFELDTAPEVSVDAATEAVDDLLGGVDEDEAEEELFDTNPVAVEHGINALLEHAEDGAGLDEAAAAPDLDPEPVAAPAPPSLDPVDAALDHLGLDTEAAAASPVAAAPVQAAASAAATGAPASTREELGEPGEWDFFGEEVEGARAASPVAAQPIVIGRVGVKGAETRPPVDIDAEPAAIAIWGRRVAHGVGWAGVCVLAALIAHQALRIAPPQAPVAASSQALAGLEASSIEGRWVENVSGKAIYVVSGDLRSAAGVRAPRARLAVRLLDASGAVVLDQAADVGPAVSMRDLREDAVADLQAAQAAGALALAWQPFSPARTRGFAAVLDGIPESASRFELTAVPVEGRMGAPAAEVGDSPAAAGELPAAADSRAG